MLLGVLLCMPRDEDNDDEHRRVAVFVNRSACMCILVILSLLKDLSALRVLSTQLPHSGVVPVPTDCSNDQTCIMINFSHCQTN